MSNGSTALALALGAGAGLGLWYLLRDDDGKAKDPGEPPTPASGDAPPASGSTPCSLRLDAKGLTADGAAIDVPNAVIACKTAGRADLVLVDNAPTNVYAELAKAFEAAGILINQRRNGRARPANPPRRRQSAGHIDLSRFSAMVRGLAEEIDEDPTPSGLARGRFGRKVFLAAIRRALQRSEYGTLPRDVIDRLLVDANRDGLLELARADLVAVMDPAEVRDSEVRSRMSTWHFVVAERLDGRNATAHRHFTLRTYPDGTRGNALVRRFHADPPTSWKDAYYRLIAAGVVDPRAAGRTHEPGGWMLSVDPADFRIDDAEALP